MTGKLLIAGLIVGAICLAAAAPAPPGPEEVAETIPAQPQRVEALPAGASVHMLEEDAHKLLEQALRAAGKTTVPLPSGEAPEPTAASNPGITRTVTIDPPPVVNPTNRFFFQDVTERTQSATGPTPRLTLEQRRAAVEAYRRTMARQKQAAVETE